MIKRLSLFTFVLFVFNSFCQDRFCPSARDQLGEQLMRVLKEWGDTSERERIEKIRVLLDQGADPNYGVRDPQGTTTLLSQAVFYAEPDMIRYLVNRGADINKNNIESDSGMPFGPVSYAMEKLSMGESLFEKRLEVLNLLLDYGPKLESKDLENLMYSLNYMRMRHKISEADRHNLLLKVFKLQPFENLSYDAQLILEVLCKHPNLLRELCSKHNF